MSPSVGVILNYIISEMTCIIYQQLVPTNPMIPLYFQSIIQVYDTYSKFLIIYKLIIEMG